MNKYHVKFTHCVVYPSTLTSGIGATYIDVDEIYEAASNTDIFTLIYTRYNVVGSITVEQIKEFSEIVNFDLNNEVYNPNFNTQQVTLDNSTEVLTDIKNKVRKEIEALRKAASLLKEAFRRITYDIEDIGEVFNSKEALEIIDKYSSITTSLDEMLYDLFSYFEDLAIVYEEKQIKELEKWNLKK